MALASFPAFQEQQWSLMRIFHTLSWAFAISPEARSFAWAPLASFWDSGLFLPLYGTDLNDGHKDFDCVALFGGRHDHERWLHVALLDGEKVRFAVHASTGRV